MAKTRAVWTIISVLVIFMIVLAVTLANVKADTVIEEDSELLLTYVVWRHGARTPVEQQINLCHDAETLTSLSRPYGYGALTDKGKQQGFEIGDTLRNRYGDFIGEKFNSTEVLFRSTDVDRTKMTGLAAMAALYAPSNGQSSWHPNLAWEPVPYTTVPVAEDFMSSVGNCLRMTTYFYKAVFPADLSLTLTDKLFEENAALLDILTEKLGANFAANPFSTYLLYDTYMSAISLGMTLPSWLSDIWDDLSTFVNEIAEKLFTVKEVLRLNSGVLLYKFLADAQAIIENEEAVSQRAKFYSAHDVNVAGICAAINAPSGYMKYASVIALELRRMVATGEIIVLSVFYPLATSDEVQYLQVGGCSSLYCNFDEFTSIVSQNAVEESVWKEECVNGDEIPLPT